MGTRISPHPIFPDGNVQSDLGKMVQSDAFRAIREVSILNGLLLENVSFKGVTVAYVPHNLGRRCKGYVVVSNNQSTAVVLDNSGNPDESKYIGLKSVNPSVGAGAVAITAATQANPCQVTSAGHGRITGDQITITGVSGMTELNGNTYTITYVDADNFTLGVNSTGYGSYSSGGTCTLRVNSTVSLWVF